MGIVAARTVRRLPTSEREESSLVVAMRVHTRGRDGKLPAAAGEAPTVKRSDRGCNREGTTIIGCSRCSQHASWDRVDTFGLESVVA